MHIDVIDDFSSITGLREQWDAVYDADPEAQFFLSSTWVFRWMTTALSQGVVLAARPGPAGSDYVAFFPLRLRTWTKKGGGFYSIVDMACQGIADYTGAICRPEHDAAVFPAFADQIRRFRWAELNLNFLRMSDERARLFLGGFPSKAFRIKDERKLAVTDGIDHAVCPYVELADDWEAHLATAMSANARQKARRLLRKIDDSETLRISHADEATYTRDIDILLSFWHMKWTQEKGRNSAALVGVVRNMANHCFEQGKLFVPVLWDANRALCALAILVDDSKKSYLFLLTGRDETYDGMAVGFALHAHAIRHAIERGFKVYDFLQGNDRYKYSFGVKERTLLNIAVIRKTQQQTLDMRCIDAALVRARDLLKEGKRAEAERGYRQIMRLDPQCAGAVYGLSGLLSAKGDHAQAQRLIKALEDGDQNKTTS